MALEQEPGIDRELLPRQFADLQPLADRFGIGDDVDRSAATDQATAEEKRLLVDAVSPRLPEINAYLDNHDDEPAHLLGRLAETTCEVALEVGWPK
jgi:hypothetical protein